MGILVLKIKILGKPRVFLDVLEPQLGLLAHQTLDQPAGLAVVVLVDRDPDQGPAAGAMVVSLSCFGIISPSPLKRLSSTLPLPPSPSAISRSFSASSLA